MNIEENSYQRALRKIDAHIKFEELPNDRADPLWLQIQSIANLSIGELSVLKNERCALPQGIFI
jgi:hypothetical protein